MLLPFKDKSPVQQPETEVGAPFKASNSFPILLKVFAVRFLNFLMATLSFNFLRSAVVKNFPTYSRLVGWQILRMHDTSGVHLQISLVACQGVYILVRVQDKVL